MLSKDFKKQQLSMQLDKQIQNLKSHNPNLISSQSMMLPFQLLQQKLRKLQQKLQRVQNTDYLPLYLQNTNQKTKWQKGLNNFLDLNLEQNSSPLSQENSHLNSLPSSNKKNKANNKSNNSTNKKSPQHQSPQTNKQVHLKSPILNKKLDNNNSTKLQNQIDSRIKQKLQHNDSRRENQNELQEVKQSTKKKKKRTKSAYILQGQSTNKNSKMATPQKRKRVVLSKAQFDQQLKKSQIHEILLSSRNHTRSVHNIHKTSDKKKDSNKKNKDFDIDELYESEFKMMSKNLKSVNSESKLKKKSQSSIKDNTMPMKRKGKQKAQKNRFPSSLTQDLIMQQDPKKFLLKNSNKNRMSCNALDHHILNYSRQPLIPFKQKVNLEKELKQYSRQNIKLKGEVSRLYKYEQKYWKMKEVFEKHDKPIILRRKQKSNPHK